MGEVAADEPLLVVVDRVWVVDDVSLVGVVVVVVVVDVVDGSLDDADVDDVDDAVLAVDGGLVGEVSGVVEPLEVDSIVISAQP